MIKSKNTDLIFIHIQKTGGTSIEKLLFDNYPNQLTTHWHGRHGHARSGISEVGRAEWDRYFSFAFVRNPWDRMVSWYKMIQEERKELPFSQQMKREPFKSPFWNHAIKDSHDFESFLINCTDVIQDRRSKKCFSFNQIDYISDEEGNIAVDFVGHFENFARDTESILNLINISYKKIPHLNISKHKHYRSYYTRKTKALIKDRFHKDIEAFGYDY